MHSENVLSTELKLNFDKSQYLRLRRFFMAVITYCMMFVALFLITRLGLGTLSPMSWFGIIGLGLVGNSVFLMLFLTGRNRRFSDASMTSAQIIFAAFWGIFPLWCLPAARPVMLMFFLPAFGFGMLRLNFKQYFVVGTWNMFFYGVMLITEFATSRPGFTMEYELFLYVIYGILLLWLAMFGGFISNIRRALRKSNYIINEAHHHLKLETDIRRQAENEKDQLILDLQEAIGEVKTLSGLLPICANCKKIRDDKGYWNQIESYIKAHTDAHFSHGICPDCKKRLYPDL